MTCNGCPSAVGLAVRTQSGGRAVMPMTAVTQTRAAAQGSARGCTMRVKDTPYGR